MATTFNSRDLVPNHPAELIAELFWILATMQTVVWMRNDAHSQARNFIAHRFNQKGSDSVMAAMIWQASAEIKPDWT